MRVRIQIVDGRRLTTREIKADNAEQAKERFMHYMALLGAIVIEEVKAVEDTDEQTTTS